MAGRGSPLSQVFPMMSLRGMQTVSRIEDSEGRNQENIFIGKPRNINPGQGAPSEASRPKSRVASDLRSNVSHSSRLRSAEVDLEMDEELRKLEEEEEDFRLQMKNLDSEIDWRNNEVIYCQKYINEDASLTKLEVKQWKLKLTENEQELSNLKRKKMLLENEEPVRMKKIRGKVASIQAKSNLKKLIIAEENEQYLGSDEEVDGAVIATDPPDVDRIEEFVKSAATETINQHQAAAEEAKLLDVKKAEEKANREAAEKLKREAEQLEIEKRIKEQSDKLKEARLRQEESDRLVAEEIQKKLDLEEELSKIKVESATIPVSITVPVTTGEEKLIQIFAEAIRGSVSSTTVPDNSKFLARQSYSKDLPHFSGKAEEWPIFYADFERSTKDCGFTNSENMSRLRKCLQGDAARYVQSLMVSPDNVPIVMKKLETRYGQPELIIEAMILKAKGVPTFKDDQLELFIEFGSAVQNVIATIKTLDRPGHLSNPQLLKEFEVKLPRNYMMQWLNWITVDLTRKRNLVDFAEWIDGQTTLACQACPPSTETVKNPPLQVQAETQSVKKKSYIKDVKKEDIPTAAGLYVGEKPLSGDRPKCIFCEKHFDSTTCSRAQDLTLDEKTNIIREKKCCDLCFKTGHRAKTCKAYVRCFVCKTRHQTVMCPELHKSEVSTPKEPKQADEGKSEQVQTSSTYLSCASKVLLKTLMVPIKSKYGTKLVRALLDDGSQRSYILKSLAQELDLLVIDSENLVHALFSGVQTTVQRHSKYCVQLKNAKIPGFSSIEVLDQERICSEIPRQSRGSWMKELKDKNIWFGDLGDDSPEIQILIGADFLGRLLTGKVLQISNGLTAVETVLGWTLMGKKNNRHQVEESTAMTIASLFVADATPAQLWDLEVIGIQDPIEKKSVQENEELAKEHFLKTVKRTVDGRYSVSLPWINEKVKIPNNKNIAEKRLESTTKRLNALGKFTDYDNIFKNWCEEGIIEEVPKEQWNDDCHYIPHRAVFKPESVTTPIRPVFDASCKAPRTPSLNECLEKGPNLLELSPSILLKFREGKIGIISDIRKAFQMIEVAEEDRDHLRFLWWEHQNQKRLKIYRHRRVVFGVNCSPFLLAAVLEHLLTNVSREEKQIAQKVLKSLYVDNCVTSVDSIEEAVELKTWATHTLSLAKMELREWEGGGVNLSGIGSLSSSECGLDFGTPNSQGKEITSVLGYKWNKVEDTLYCDLESENLPEQFSKRKVLSYLQKIYDPIGFTCPVTLQPKLLLQKLWDVKIGWDEDLAEDHKNDFATWCNQISTLKEVKIPRNMTGGISSRENWQIHAFGDASQDAFASVIFLRTEDGGKVSVQLLMAKSRVAPLKKPTINRLELLSCYITATLTNFVKEALSLTDVPTFYWSDSSTALAWIRRNDEWGTFVGNRVRTICKLTNTDDWRHIPGINNPADLPSRGCTSEQLLTSRWWEGPDWLKKPMEEWPSEEIVIREEDVAAEKKKSPAVTVMTSQILSTPELETTWYCSKSTFRRNVVSIAWLRRFVSFLSKNREDRTCGGALSVEEIDEAKKCLYRLVQKETLPVNTSVIAGIHVNHGEDGLVRVKTKLNNREDTEDFLNPILLPTKHVLVDQIILEEHMKNKHAGAQFMVAKLRENFWIIQTRRAVKKVLNKCVVCRRYDTKKPNVVPASLPEGRVTTSKVFQTIGVDFAGPLFTKEGGKAWILLITCAVYRCIHLELVMSLSTDSFLDAFSRFTARRGRPENIYSDNGTNFVGAHNALKDLDWEKIRKEHAMEKIHWTFIPPASPWWGGFYERLVRSVKSLLKRTLGKSKLTYEKLETCVIEVEAIINGRPLTVVTEDPNDLIPLTPAMYLHEMMYPGVTDRELLEASGFQKLLQRRKNFLDDIKMRFRREYLALLVHRGKEKPIRQFQVGDIVLVGSDDKKRWEWPMARILELMPGKDGYVRVARLKTATGILVRPIQWLFAMEISSPSDVSEETEKVKTRCGRVVKVPSRLGQ